MRLSQSVSIRSHPVAQRAARRPDTGASIYIRAWDALDGVMGRFVGYPRSQRIEEAIQFLAARYPVVQSLVGAAFFRIMARVFIRRYPPHLAGLHSTYGAEFSAFIATFPPVAALIYLADIARLEYARVLASQAVDMPAMRPADLHDALRSRRIQRRLSERWHLLLHPSVQVLHFRYAALSIWAAHQLQSEQLPLRLAEIDIHKPQAGLILRCGHEVEVLPVSVTAARFIQDVKMRRPLIDAARKAKASDPSFDVYKLLGHLLQRQALIDFEHVAGLAHL